MNKCFIFQNSINISLDGLEPSDVKINNCPDCKCVNITDGFYFKIQACKVHEPIFEKYMTSPLFDGHLSLFIKPNPGVPLP